MSRFTLLAAAAALALVAPNLAFADAAEGKELFESKCGVCHNADSKEKKIGPGLAGIKDGKLPSGKDTTDENLLENLNEGGGGMPAFDKLLTDEEKNDLIAYMKTL